MSGIFISTKYKNERGGEWGGGGHACNCAIAVGFKVGTRVSCSVINAVVESLLGKNVWWRRFPHACLGGRSISTSPPAAAVAATSIGKKKRSIISSRSGTYFSDSFKPP